MLWKNLDLDLLFLQESAIPKAEQACHGQLVNGNKWGSAVIVRSGRIDPIDIPNYEGWVVGGEVLESNLTVNNRRLFAFSIHSPSSGASGKRKSYVEEVDAIITILVSVVPPDFDLILGGDFNFTIGERQDGEFQVTLEAERKVIQRLTDLGLSSCWSISHPGKPLEQTLRWVSDHAPHKSTPFHCDGIFVPTRWKDRVICEVFTGQPFWVSDHNPVVAWIDE